MRPKNPIPDEKFIEYIINFPNATAPGIGKHYGIRRQNAYNRLRKLENKGIVEITHGIRKGCYKLIDK